MFTWLHRDTETTCTTLSDAVTLFPQYCLVLMPPLQTIQPSMRHVDWNMQQAP